MRLAAHGLRVFTSNWAGFALQFVTGVLIVRLLGAQGRGVVALVTSAAMLFGTLGQLGFPTAGIYLMQKEGVSARALLAKQALLAVAVTALGALALFLAMPLFARAFLDGAEGAAPLLWLALPLVPAQMILAFAGVLLLARRDSGYYARVTLLTSVSTLLLTVVLVVIFHLGVAGAVIAIVASQVGAAVMGAILLARGTDMASRGTGVTLRRMLSLGLPHYAGSVGAQTFKRLDNFLIAYFLGPSPVGYYSVALTAYDGALSIPRALSGLVAGEAAKRPAPEAAALVATSTRRALLVMVGLVLVCSLLAWPLVPLVYGADFRSAVPPLQILLAAGAVVGWIILVQTYFVAIGRMGVSGGLTLLAGAANLGLSLALIPIWGLVGCALATLISSTASAFLHGFWFRRLSGQPVKTAIFLAGDLRAARMRSLKSFLLDVRQGPPRSNVEKDR